MQNLKSQMITEYVQEDASKDQLVKKIPHRTLMETNVIICKDINKRFP